MMSQVQAALWLTGARAVFSHRDASGVEWFKLPTGAWVGKRAVNGMVELRQHAAGSCNCG